MKNLYLISIIFVIIFINLLPANVFGGNDRRLGEAGASELLINPWAKSSGWADANVACVTGLEAIYQNVAGLSFAKSLEVGFTNTQYLVPSGIMLNNGGLAVRVGKEKKGVLGVSVMNMSWGSIDVTTNDLPDGNGGTFSPTQTIISLAYAREFSNSIHGGITVKMVNESIATINATGVCFDAGIQYVTGFGRNKNNERNRDNFRFGIAMKNVGSTMKYSGDGITFIGWSPNNDHTMTVEHRSQQFEMPSLIKIAFSYDIRFYEKARGSIATNEEDEENERVQYVTNHKLTIAGNFTANSYTHDQFHLGLEYGFKNILFIRGGYMYELGIISMGTVEDSNGNSHKEITTENASTALLGPTAGISLQWPFNKKTGAVIAVDYSYRFTNTFNGIHTFGLRIDL